MCHHSSQQHNSNSEIDIHTVYTTGIPWGTEWGYTTGAGMPNGILLTTCIAVWLCVCTPVTRADTKGSWRSRVYGQYDSQDVSYSWCCTVLHSAMHTQDCASTSAVMWFEVLLLET